ncbi:SURF1 family protein [Vibrio sinaloensis]|uniref:SURF1 family protein n=1 Tax=Photobacterium sp. (strain ATCC 43367) TaxID=379097 RepID=UPI0022AE67D7|nr:SURF1 family protein [Vibrio sinaloensis]MCZ4293475.1 SURF1 family protein [Vibrio sinaloensis]
MKSSSNTNTSLKINTMRRSFVSHIRIGRFVVGFVLTVVVFSILVNLGFWQLSRAAEKTEIEQQVTQRQHLAAISLDQLSDEMRNEPIGLKVHFQAQPMKDKLLLLDNQHHQGKVGYLALQLVESAGGKRVIVERGFVPAPRLRDELPEVDWLELPLNIEGRLYRKSVNPLSHELLIESGPISRIQNLNFAELETFWKVKIEPYVVQPISESWPYPQPWQPVSMNAQKHWGYAVQWFSMAGVLAIISGLVLIRIMRQGASHD